MKSFRFRLKIPAAGLVAFLWCPLAVPADETNSTPDFKEVYDLLRANLAGQSDADLNRAAVQGLLNQLRPKASLGPGAAETNAAAGGSLLAQTITFDGPIVYLRVADVANGLADQLTAAYKPFTTTNKLIGMVVDMRYAGGADYTAATAAASAFISKEKPLLDWGPGPVRSRNNPDAIAVPVAVLVNHQTSGAAEALAAVLRESDQAIILGSPTAGEAMIGKDFPLKTGGFLRIATAAVKLGSGEVLSTAGIKPDIAVAVKPEDEKVYYADPYKEIFVPLNLVAAFSGVSANATNRTPRTRTTEADLIRERKERPGMELEGGPSPTNTVAGSDTEKPVVHDPVLARALDLLKAISAMHPARTP